MASLSEIFQGTPPTYGVNVVGGGKSPLFDFAKTFGQYLKGLIGQPLPSYPGQIDPGMSPTMGALGQMLQAYSRSPLPQVMGQAGGVLGRFMNPSFANPMARMQFGFPNYFGGGGMSGMQAPGQPPMPPGMPGIGGPPPPGVTPSMPPPSNPFPPHGVPLGPGGPSVSPAMPPGLLEMLLGQGGPTGPQVPYGNDMSPQPMPMQNMTGTPDFGMPAGGGMDSMNGGPYIAPPAPPKKRGQMTRQEWIDAGLKPGERGTKGGKGHIKNLYMPMRGGLVDDMGGIIRKSPKPKADYPDRLRGNPG